MLIQTGRRSWFPLCAFFALVACGGRSRDDASPPGALLGGNTSIGTTQTSLGGSSGGLNSIAFGGGYTVGTGGTYSAKRVSSGGHVCWVMSGTPDTAPVDRCGDGDLESYNGETCDDGNRKDGDGCSSTCHLEVNSNCPMGCGPCVRTLFCSNGIVETGETCDDGNTKPGDGCSSECTRELGAYVCDPGALCTVSPKCGDGTLDPGEECDPGYDFGDAGTGSCTSICTIVRGSCGDGTLDPGEECDEGGFNEDGVCDGCGNKCKLGPYCGDGIVQSNCGEVCDDGVNSGAYGTCNTDCTLTPYCGDGIVQPMYGEQCDDGPNNGGDRLCDTHCHARMGQ